MLLGNAPRAVEQAADRIHMAARLFIHLLDQRGASLRCRIRELLAMADAADSFHRGALWAGVGGGVASVMGGVATIAGLVLAPVTVGTSIIITAVGITVATAGSITSAAASITDTVRFKMDRRRVERTVHGYQHDAQDLQRCLEFVQEGVDTLRAVALEAVPESAPRRPPDHNIKHVVREGGHAGKLLVVNGDRLVHTLQALGVAGGVAKVTRAVSVATGVMAALFLALDVFFLAKGSMELLQGGRTQLAAAVRELCGSLQHGLEQMEQLGLQLQETLDGSPLGGQEEEGVGGDLDLDLLEQEVDLLEQEMDRKLLEQLRRSSKEEEKKRGWFLFGRRSRRRRSKQNRQRTEEENEQRDV